MLSDVMFGNSSRLMSLLDLERNIGYSYIIDFYFLDSRSMSSIPSVTPLSRHSRSTSSSSSLLYMLPVNSILILTASPPHPHLHIYSLTPSPLHSHLHTYTRFSTPYPCIYIPHLHTPIFAPVALHPHLYTPTFTPTPSPPFLHHQP